MWRAGSSAGSGPICRMACQGRIRACALEALEPLVLAEHDQEIAAREQLVGRWVEQHVLLESFGPLASVDHADDGETEALAHAEGAQVLAGPHACHANAAHADARQDLP